jgi:hypothetical protein
MNRIRQWTGKLRIRPKKIPKIAAAAAVSAISLGLPSMEPVSTGLTVEEKTLVEGPTRPATTAKKQES